MEGSTKDWSTGFYLIILCKSRTTYCFCWQVFAIYKFIDSSINKYLCKLLLNRFPKIWGIFYIYNPNKSYTQLKHTLSLALISICNLLFHKWNLLCYEPCKCFFHEDNQMIHNITFSQYACCDVATNSKNKLKTPLYFSIQNVV